MQPYAGLYYGMHQTTVSTFKKSLLLHDELHVFDRSSFGLKNGLGTIGELSPMRRMPSELQREDVRVICHEPIVGPLEEAMRQAISDDLADPLFVRTFVNEFFGTKGFAWQFLAKKATYNFQSAGNRAFTGADIFERMRQQDWAHPEFSIERLEGVDNQEIMSVETPRNLTLYLNWIACEASHHLNCFLMNSVSTEAIPFTDIPGYHQLLLAKYDRARKSTSLAPTAKVTYLASTVFDELLTDEILEHRTIGDVLNFRTANARLLEDFRGYLRQLQHKIESEPLTPEFESELKRLLDLDVFPKVKEYRDTLHESWSTFFGSLAVRAAAGTAVLVAAVLKDATIEMLAFGGAAGVAGVAAAEVNTLLKTRRETDRKNGLAYLLRFKSHS